MKIWNFEHGTHSKKPWKREGKPEWEDHLKVYFDRRQALNIISILSHQLLLSDDNDDLDLSFYGKLEKTFEEE